MAPSRKSRNRLWDVGVRKSQEALRKSWKSSVVVLATTASPVVDLSRIVVILVWYFGEETDQLIVALNNLGQTVSPESSARMSRRRMYVEPHISNNVGEQGEVFLSEIGWYRIRVRWINHVSTSFRNISYLS
jgi:hypothetical protein